MKITGIAKLLCFGTVLMPSIAAIAQNSTQAPEQKKTEYIFKQRVTPVKLTPYNTIVYSCSPNSVLTIRGDELYNTSNNILDIVANPSGVNVGVLEENKKGKRDVAFYSTSVLEEKMADFNEKKYGQPAALVYTPDAKKVLVATDKGLFTFEPRKMVPIDTMELLFTPEKMIISDNAYYLTISAGDRVAVYNLDKKRVRRDWTYGVNVTDMAFSNGSDAFAVLTDDGILTVYDTRNFNIKNTIEDLGTGIACVFNHDGKYIIVATSPETLETINLVRPTDRNTLPIEDGNITDLAFIPDSEGNSILMFTGFKKLHARRLQNLEPHFAKLISDGVDQKMAEWEKLMPGESMEDYRLRMNEESRARQRRLFEDEVSTELAGDLLADATMSLGSYDRTNQVLALDFSTMPTIYLPVPESDVTAFQDANDLILSDVQYGVLPDDSFEIIFAKVFNKVDGKTYEYNNLDRVSMDFMGGDANVVSLEILQQQQMEELKLQELREKVVEEARNTQLISNHTNIGVDSKVVPDYDANGDKILNYEVNFTYQVDPEFSAVEDFAPGKYVVNESGAASAMIKIIKDFFEGDFAQYVKEGKKLKVNISGTADASAIRSTIPYTGIYGDFEDEPIYENGALTAITVTKAKGIKENRQLGFLRAEGVKDFLLKNVENLDKMDADYSIHVDVAEGKGSEFRRITAKFTFVDAL